MHQQQHKNKISLPKGDNTQHNPERAICQATVIMQLPNGDTRETVITTDPCNSASMAKRALLHDIKTCNHYNQQPIRMTTVTGPSPWYKEMGILRFRDGANKKVSVLCYVHEKDRSSIRRLDNVCDSGRHTSFHCTNDRRPISDYRASCVTLEPRRCNASHLLASH